MASQLRMTMTTRAVLRILLESGGQPRYGLDMAREAQLAGGTMYPLLGRLEKGGWVKSTWQEDPAPGRPARRYYTLVDPERTKAALLDAQRRVLPARLLPRPPAPAA